MELKSLIARACTFALVANSLATTGTLAQNKQQDKQQDKQPAEQKVERHVIITPDGKQIITIPGDGQRFEFRLQGPDGDVLVPNLDELRGQMDKLKLDMDLLKVPKIDLEGLSARMKDFKFNFQDIEIPRIDFGAEAFGAMPMPLIGQGGDVFQFVSTEMSFDVRSVKGAPFSAVTVSESTQVLGDGNRITQHTEGRVYRDSQGRTRNERTFRMGGSDKERQTIVIYDPTNHTTITLDPQTRTARKMGPPPPPPPPPAPAAPPAPPAPPAAPSAPPAEAPKKVAVSTGVLQNAAIKRVQPPYPPVAKAAQAQGPVQVQTVINETGNVVEATVISGHPLLREAATEAARQWEFKPTEVGGKPVKVQGVLTFNFTLADKEGAEANVALAKKMAEAEAAMGQDRVFQRISPDARVKKEDLGKQMVEGVECEGKRVTTTIPAGSIGNERAIESVRETWYSPELKTTVMSKSTDPRFGESSYRLTGITRTEPEASLFQVPDGYTVKENNFKFRTAPDFGAGGVFQRRVKEEAERRMQNKIEKKEQ